MLRTSRIAWLILLTLVMAGSRSAGAQPPQAGKIIHLQGQVMVRPSGTEKWVKARINQELGPGDAIRTGPASRTAILCVDESQIQLQENTTIILKEIVPSPHLQAPAVTPAILEKPPASLYQVPNGEIWLRNKNEKFRFELETPVITATIRGTEFVVRVQPDGITTVTLLEGQVWLINPLGELCLQPGEEGFASPGKGPSKRVLVQPADAAQWVLYYPGIFSYRDLPLSPRPGETRLPASPPPLAALIQQGEAAYDQGNLPEAEAQAKAVLAQAPDNGRALTLMGWVRLQHNAPEEALGYFRRVRDADDRTIIGMALCRYRLGDLTGAYELVQAASQKLRPAPFLLTMAGYFAMLAGQIDKAVSQLEAASRQLPDAALPRALLAQIYLVQNRKDAALSEANTALSQSPNSPVALLSLALVKMSQFDLPAAIPNLQKALAADPRFVDAYVYLAKIWLGSEYLGWAQQTVDQARQLAPQDAEVLSLAGFVRLAYRDYTAAQRLFLQASEFDPSLGEPHLGLATYHFRHRNFTQGLTEMLTATLLDPRLSQYQSQLGKALYQAHAFDKALEVWDYAKSLDPKDPTPHLYKGIALTDLNRPGEAIQEINKSIELNDNVAMFRARQSLDQDLAVRNAGLARAYQQLGLTEWALSKAVTAVKYEPVNSAAHLFLADITVASRAGAAAPFFTSGHLLGFANTEAALFRVLSPANQATYRSLQFAGTEALGLTRDYAPMFEMPFARVGVSGGLGAAEGSKLRQDHQAVAYGGGPGLSFETYGRFLEEPLGPPTSGSLHSFSGRNRTYTVEANVKWEPSVKGTLTGLFQYIDVQIGTQRKNLPSNPTVRDDINTRNHFYELAYYHRFNPRAALLAYFVHNDFPFRTLQTTSLFGFPLSVPYSFDQEFQNIQLQQHLVLPFLGQHSLIAGFDYFTCHVNQKLNIELAGFSLLAAEDRPPFRSSSLYLQDYWRLHRNLVLELALFWTNQKDPRGFPGTFYTTMWSPRFGINYQFKVGKTQHVLRGVAERHLTSHLAAQPILLPAEIGGFPWVLDFTSGSEVRQAGAAWEAQWDPKTFTTLRLNALRVATPVISNTFTPGFPGPSSWQTWKRYQASLVLNRILTTSLGLALGVLGKRVVPDLSFQDSDNLQDYSEFNAFLSLSYLNRQGWLARITPLLVQQFGKISGYDADNPFVILNLSLGREFPHKRGFALFEVQNLFNRQPFYSIEPRRDLEFASSRRFLFRLGFYF